MKYIKYLFLIMLVLTCTACGKREAIRGEDLVKSVGDSYKVTDEGEQFDFADSAYRIKGSYRLDVIYVDTKTLTAKNIYVDETKNAYLAASNDLISLHKDEKNYEVKEEDVDDTVVTGDNFSIVEINTSDKYYRIVWIDDTVMYGSVSIKHKTDLLKLMKGLGY